MKQSSLIELILLAQAGNSAWEEKLSVVLAHYSSGIYVSEQELMLTHRPKQLL